MTVGTYHREVPVKAFIVLLSMLFAVSAYAADDDEVANCLRSWGKHPFKEKPEFRVISSKVRVMGVGSNVEDTRPTDKPELVLLKPAVSVMSKSTMDLMNPNGWYCLKGKVDVLGKTEINLHCNAHMASSTGGVAVMGSNVEEKGVTVLGKSVINRKCEHAKGGGKGEDAGHGKGSDKGEKSDPKAM